MPHGQASRSGWWRAHGGILQQTRVPGYGRRESRFCMTRSPSRYNLLQVVYIKQKRGHMETKMTPQTNEATRILLVDDFQAFRDSVRSLLEESPGYTVVGEAEDGLTAMQLAETLRPDVVLMDVNISRLDGVTATRQIKALLPETSIIGISAAPTPYAREEMLKAGARGFVQKEQIPDELLAAIEQAIRDRLLHL